MITDYTSLKTSIASFVHSTRLTDMVPEFIAAAEARIYNDLRIRAMEEAFSSAISSGVVAVPASFIEWKFLYIDGTPVQKLERHTVEWMLTNYPERSASGRPIAFARDGDNLIFGPYPDSAYTVKGRYYKRLAALSDSNTTNWFTANEPDLLRYAALCEAAPFMVEDNRVALWEGKYAAIKERIQRAERREEFSGSQLSVTPS